MKNNVKFLALALMCFTTIYLSGCNSGSSGSKSDSVTTNPGGKGAQPDSVTTNPGGKGTSVKPDSVTTNPGGKTN